MTEQRDNILVSCIMPTYNRRRFVPMAIRYFLRQDYEPKELIIVDDGTDAIGDLVPSCESIRYIRLNERMTLGVKRNLACEEAKGEIIIHWDDDDWSAAFRISYQTSMLKQERADICGLKKVLFFDAEANRAWEYSYSSASRKWVYGASLCYTRQFWKRNPFPHLNVGEDSRFVWQDRSARIAVLDQNTFMAALVHQGNTSPKRTTDSCWHPQQIDRVCTLLGPDWEFYGNKGSNAGPGSDKAVRGTALVSAAYGIGDILRITPLIRVLHQQGYQVDILLAPDYPETGLLLEGAREIRKLISYENFRKSNGRKPVPGIEQERYDLAVFTVWSVPLQQRVKAVRSFVFDKNQWLREGDSKCVQAIARAIGWDGPLPPPFVMPSGRSFGLPPGTVALHPGCKPDWPWKKWHGFAELAKRFQHVAVIGTNSDHDVSSTYFRNSFQWPDDVMDFTGKLNLRDTAALIKQSAALVCNDSGMMHIGAAVGTPTFPIFGITNPDREVMPVANVYPLTAGLSCESGCRTKPWGRRDCDRHLECLKTLREETVIERVIEKTKKPTLVKPVNLGQGKKQKAQADNETLTVAIRIAGGIGDVIIASLLVKELYDEIPGGRIDIFYRNPEVAKFVFRKSRCVHNVHPVSAFTAASQRADLNIEVLQFVTYNVRDPKKLARINPHFAQIVMHMGQRFESYRGLYEKHPLLDGLWGRISVKQGRTIIANLGYLGGLPIDKHSQYLISPEPEAYTAAIQKANLEKSYITVHDGFDNNHGTPPGGATKCWPLEHWTALVRLIKKTFPDITLIQLGAKKSRAIPGIDLNLIQQTNFDEAAWIIKNGVLHIDTESGLVHLARAMHAKSAVLFGPTDQHYYGYEQNINLVAEKCGNCWWSTPDWLSRCPRGLAKPECMYSITPETVFAHVEEHLCSKEKNKYQAKNLSFYDSLLCKRLNPTLQNIFSRAELTPVPISQHAKNTESGTYIHASKQWEYLFAIEQIEKHCGSPFSGLAIADVGGGRGALAPYLASLGNNLDVFDSDYLWDHGDDLNVEIRYRKWANGRGYRAKYGSLYNLPVEDATYDVVACVSVVEHIPHKLYMLKEAMRVLKPGGVLILTFDFAAVPHRYEDGLRQEIFSPERLVETFSQIGISMSALVPESVERSIRDIQRDQVLGIPHGMTVGGVAIQKSRSDN